jgi:hypothetical protein
VSKHFDFFEDLDIDELLTDEGQDPYGDHYGCITEEPRDNWEMVLNLNEALMGSAYGPWASRFQGFDAIVGSHMDVWRP